MKLEQNSDFPENLLKYLGLNKDAFSAGQISSLWEEAWMLLNIKVFEKELGLNVFFSIFSPYAEKSNAVKRLLKDCHTVILMIATLGTRLEQQVKNDFALNQTFKGYILDRMGSYMVESAIRDLDKKINSRYNRSRQTCTIRYSPGYQDFPLACQQVFVRLGQHELPFLKIRPNFQLAPEKTITAIKGIKIRQINTKAGCNKNLPPTSNI